MTKHKLTITAALFVTMFAMPTFSDETAPVVVTSERLEREKFEFQKKLELEKLKIERSTAWLTGGSILIPLLLGVVTILWQSRSAMKIKDRDARDAFELKVAEIVFASETARGIRARAVALADLFPNRLPATFADKFVPEKFDMPRYQAMVEVFRAAVSKAATPKEVYEMWNLLFPGDDWLEPLLHGTPPRVPNARSAEMPPDC